MVYIRFIKRLSNFSKFQYPPVIPAKDQDTSEIFIGEVDVDNILINTLLLSSEAFEWSIVHDREVLPIIAF